MRVLQILLLFLFVSACASKPEEKPKEKKPDATKPELVGRVASIPASRRFVLIQSYGKWDVATGSILTTEGPGGRAANLRATGEKLGQYAAADIQSGTLEIGDGVFKIVKSPETPSSDEAEESDEKPDKETKPAAEKPKVVPTEEPSILDDSPPSE